MHQAVDSKDLQGGRVCPGEIQDLKLHSGQFIIPMFPFSSFPSSSETRQRGWRAACHKLWHDHGLSIISAAYKLKCSDNKDIMTVESWRCGAVDKQTVVCDPDLALPPYPNTFSPHPPCLFRPHHLSQNTPCMQGNCSTRIYPATATPLQNPFFVAITLR